MATITPEQRREIENAGAEAIRIEDPETHAEYVLVKADVYNRMRALLEHDRSDRSLYEFGEFYPVES